MEPGDSAAAATTATATRAKTDTDTTTETAEAKTETKAEAPKITNYLSPETIDLNISGESPEQVIRHLAGLGAGTGAIGDIDTVVAAAMKREEQGATAVGDGIAIPHAKSDGATRPVLAFGRSAGVDWQAPDGKPSDLIFLIAVPEAQAGDEHLRILAALSRALMRTPVRDGLRNADDAQEVIRVLDEAISG
ncbi:PTS sugar transporter subunit IIA [Enemella sp. A6]|uniref:PTS sugar transporter subunit IIA n=1 Tax=Enemella sp. A6 TaxID=3440152 RepID=UPI003EBA915F